MKRLIIAVIVGLLVTSAAVGLVQWIGHQLFPLPAGADPNNPEDIKEYVKTAPFMALFFVIISYAAGAIAGGFTATKIARDSSRAPVFIIGSLFALFSFYMMMIIPSPFWFWILGIGVWGLVFVGRKLARNTTSLKN